MLKDTDREVATFLNRKFSGLISTIETLPKEDLDLVSLHAATFNFLIYFILPIQQGQSLPYTRISHHDNRVGFKIYFGC